MALRIDRELVGETTYVGRLHAGIDAACVGDGGAGAVFDVQPLRGKTDPSPLAYSGLSGTESAGQQRQADEAERHGKSATIRDMVN